jgi:pyruvate dehydrogenase E2 component (dihydrolipoamide acetyltransferase)
MPIEIIVPRLGWSMEEGVFVDWLKQEGEFVQAGDLLFRIEGDKAVQEIESIDSGVLRISPDGPKAGAAIRVGQLLGHLWSAEELRSGTIHPAPAPASEKSSMRETALATLAPAPPLANPVAEESPPRVPTISPRARRVAAELQVDWTRLSGTGRTGRIRERDVRAAAHRVPASAGAVPE